jgi:hypothetical protein
VGLALSGSLHIRLRFRYDARGFSDIAILADAAGSGFPQMGHFSLSSFGARPGTAAGCDPKGSSWDRGKQVVSLTGH